MTIRRLYGAIALTLCLLVLLIAISLYFGIPAHDRIVTRSPLIHCPKLV